MRPTVENIDAFCAFLIKNYKEKVTLARVCELACFYPHAKSLYNIPFLDRNGYILIDKNVMEWMCNERYCYSINIDRIKELCHLKPTLKHEESEIGIKIRFEDFQKILLRLTDQFITTMLKRDVLFEIYLKYEDMFKINEQMTMERTIDELQLLKDLENDL
jgi:hypothetical protein